MKRAKSICLALLSMLPLVSTYGVYMREDVYRDDNLRLEIVMHRPQSLPSIVKISASPFLGAGAFIADNLILTSAHTFFIGFSEEEGVIHLSKPLGPDSIKILIQDPSDPFTEFRGPLQVKRIYIHSSYDPRLPSYARNCDVAIVELEEPVDVKMFPPFKISEASPEEIMSTGEVFYGAGYGEIGFSNPGYPSVPGGGMKIYYETTLEELLRQGTDSYFMSLVDNPYGSEYPNAFLITSDLAPLKGRVAKGDSGEPLLNQNGEIVALAKGIGDDFDTFLSLYDYRDWINGGFLSAENNFDAAEEPSSVLQAFLFDFVEGVGDILF